MIRLKLVLIALFAIFGSVVGVISPYTLAGVNQTVIEENKISVVAPEYSGIEFGEIVELPNDDNDDGNIEEDKEPVVTYKMVISASNSLVNYYVYNGKFCTFVRSETTSSGYVDKFIVTDLSVRSHGVSYDIVTYHDGVEFDRKTKSTSCSFNAVDSTQIATITDPATRLTGTITCQLVQLKAENII